MSWEHDPTWSSAPAPSRRRDWRAPLVALLASLLLGCSGVVGAWYEDHPHGLPMENAATPSPVVYGEGMGVPTGPPLASSLTAAAEAPLTPFDVMVQPTAATVLVALPPQPSEPRDEMAGAVAAPTYRWRVLIPARGPAYYALGVTLDVRAAGDASAGPATLWYYDGRTATAVPDPGITVAVGARQLLMTISDPTLIAQVFAEYPSVVTMEGATPDALPLTTALVRYTDVVQQQDALQRRSSIQTAGSTKGAVGLYMRQDHTSLRPLR
jgi:hypothetical protein